MASERSTRRIICDEVIEEVATLISFGKPGHVIRARIRAWAAEHLGRQSVSRRTCDRVMRRARELIVIEAGVDRAYMRALLVQTCRNIIAAPDSTPRDKIAAVDRICQMLGLDAKHEIARGTSRAVDDLAADIRAAVSAANGTIGCEENPHFPGLRITPPSEDDGERESA